MIAFEAKKPISCDVSHMNSASTAITEVNIGTSLSINM
jgi:hypothetical protein